MKLKIASLWLLLALVLSLVMVALPSVSPAKANWPGKYELTVDVSPIDSGTIKIDGTAPPSYPYTRSCAAGPVNLEAVPAAGYEFKEWGGNLIGSTNPTSITMNTNMNIEAIFVQITYTLTVDVSPTDGGDIEVNGTAPSSYPNSSTFAQGASVELRAVPAPGYEFDHWSGVPSGAEKENPTTTPVASATKVTAHFTKPASFPWWLILVGVAAFLLAIIMGRLVYRLTTRRTSIQAH